MGRAHRQRLSLWAALTAALLATTVAGVAAPSAVAQKVAPSVPLQIIAQSPDAKPPGFRLSAGDAVEVAVRVKGVRRELARGNLDRLVAVPGYVDDPYRWQVTYSRDGKGVVEVHIDAIDGRVLELWTGPQVDFLLARPWKDKTAGALNKAWIWIPLCLLFLAPFIDPRRPFRLLHLDLLVLLSFGVAQLFFNDGRLDVWVPAVYPVLGYLLARMLFAGFRPRERRERLIPFARESWLLGGLLLLVVGRIVLNVVDSAVIDVGYQSVVGADNLIHGGDISGYGPLMFLAYVPFELIFPWHGAWDAVPAAHAAALTFDLLTVVGLVLLGRSLRPGREGRIMGIALAYAWVAFPYSTYVLQENTNDGLLAMLLVYTMLALRSPAGSGFMLALATAAKFFPAALAPLLASGTGDRNPRSLLRFAGAFVAVCLVAVYVVLPDGGLRELWHDTIGYQLGRESPFSLWGLHPSLEWIQLILEAGTLALCVALYFVPGRRDARQVAALAAAVVIALELCATYWLFFYVSWFTPLALVAMLGAYRDPLRGDSRPATESGLRLFSQLPIYGEKARVTERPRRLADPDLSHLKRGRPMLRKLRERIHNGEKGFTLIELLVVILIIGILAAIALPAFLGQRSKGQDADAKSAARNLVSAVESFYATNQTYAGAATDTDVTDSGVFGSGNGQASLPTATATGYVIVGNSASNNKFTITKSGATVTRTCTTTKTGACPSTGNW